MYKFWWDQDNRVVRINISGPQEAALPSETTEEFISLLNTLPGKVDILVDCQQAQIDTAFLKNLKKINPEPGQLDLAKRKIKHIGLFGLDPLQRIKLEMMLVVGGFNIIRLFSREKDALNWLKKDSS